MIALGGTIGTGLFVGSGQTLALGGPAFILVSYIIITILVYFIVTAITEVATYLPPWWHNELLRLSVRVKEYGFCDGLSVLVCSWHFGAV